MPDAPTRPAKETPSTDAVVAAAATGTLVGGAAPPAGAAVTASATVVTGAQVAAAVGRMMKLIRGTGTGDEAAWLWLFNTVRPEFPSIPESVLKDMARREVDREATFWQRMEQRLKRDIPVALAKPDPEDAVDRILRRERHFMQLHQQACAARLQGAARADQVKRLSPEGAYWRLGPNVKKHTPDCIAMAIVGWWPWSVLNKIRVPVHVGCQCELLTHAEARDFGLMGDVIPTVVGAEARAARIATEYGDLQEAIWRNGDTEDALIEHVGQFVEAAGRLGDESAFQSHPPVTRVSATGPPGAPAADPSVLQEVAIWPDAREDGEDAPHERLESGLLDPLEIEEAAYGRRYKAGTIWGGRFMPKTGARAAPLTVTDALKRLLSYTPGGNPRGMRSAPTPPKAPPAAPSQVGTAASQMARSAADGAQLAATFDDAAQEVRALAGKVAAEHGKPASGIGTITVDHNSFDTTGLRTFGGDIEVGPEAETNLLAYAQAVASGERPPDDISAGAYHAKRTLIHETLHSINPMAADDYMNVPHRFAMEEALTEEMAHVLTVEQALGTKGGQDMLRWHARAQIDDLRANGVYQPQRGGLAMLLDEAQVPVEARRGLIEQLKFGMDPQQREVILGALIGKAQGSTPEAGRERVEAVMGTAAGMDPLAKGSRALVPHNSIDSRNTKLAVGARVEVDGRYRGKITDAGPTPDGRYQIEVEVKTEDGKRVWRYPDPLHVTLRKEAKPPELPEGPKVKGKIHEGDHVDVKQPNGEDLRVRIARIEGEDALGWRAQGVTPTGEAVVLRSDSVTAITPAPAPKKPEPVEAAKAKAESAPKGASQSKKAQKTAPHGPESAQKGPLQEVSGPRGFDARNYEDPRRSMLRKMRALQRGGKPLELADGSRITRGQRGDSFLMERPDGSTRRYATSIRLSKAEMVGIEGRHGVGGMASPGDGPERGPAAERVLGKYRDTEDKHTIYVEGLGRVYTDERKALHEEIIDHFLKGHKPPEGTPKALFTAGAPGSGKSTILNSKGVETPLDAVDVNPDLVKEMLPEFKVMVKERDPYTGAGVHEESSSLARAIRDRAREAGLNIVLDGVGDSAKGRFRQKMQQMHDAGYDVEALVAHLPPEKGHERVEARAERTGRTVPHDVVASYYSRVPERFEEYDDELPWLGLRLYSTDVARGAEAKLIAEKKAGEAQLQIDRPDDLAAFRALGSMGGDGKDLRRPTSGLSGVPGQASPGVPGGPDAGAAQGGRGGAAGQASPGVPKDLTALTGTELDHLDAEVMGGPDQAKITAEHQRRGEITKAALTGLRKYSPPELAQADPQTLATARSAALYHNLTDLHAELKAALSEPPATDARTDPYLAAEKAVTAHREAMYSPGWKQIALKLTGGKDPKRAQKTERSLMEAPPEPVTGIPDYSGTDLTDVKAAGGSNGARIAEDASGKRWLVKTYKGNSDRVATELLANAIYRDLGVTVPNAGTTVVDVPTHGKTAALTYPLVDGELRHWSKPDEQLAEGFVADALLANWDVVGLAQDNVLWNGDTPVRLDQGGTLEYRAMGGSKPFGPVPTELWTMNQPRGQAYRRMAITDAGMRAAAGDAALRLPDGRIDELVDATPFADDAMRERVRENLKARVGWLDRFSRGEENLPEPTSGVETVDSFTHRDANLLTTPEEDVALQDFLDEPQAVDQQLRSQADKRAASPEVVDIISTLDGLLQDPAVRTADDTYIYMPMSLENLGADTIDQLAGKWFLERSYFRGDAFPPDSSTYLRLLLPSGSKAVLTDALDGLDAPTPGTVVLPRMTKLEIAGGGEQDGKMVIEGVATTR